MFRTYISPATGPSIPDPVKGTRVVDLGDATWTNAVKRVGDTYVIDLDVPTSEDIASPKLAVQLRVSRGLLFNIFHSTAIQSDRSLTRA